MPGPGKKGAAAADGKDLTENTDFCCLRGTNLTNKLPLTIYQGVHIGINATVTAPGNHKVRGAVAGEFVRADYSVTLTCFKLNTVHGNSAGSQRGLKICLVY